MNIGQIEQNVRDVFVEFSQESFIYRLLEAYGKPKASITRLQKGTLNLSKNQDEIVWKNQLLFRQSTDIDLHVLTDKLSKGDEVSRYNLRFVVVTDWTTLLAVDTKTSETLDIQIEQLPKHFDFFLPWAGHEKHSSHNESQADIKAAYRMAKLYDEIWKEHMDEDTRHAMNVFLSRILFCFFAEDTEIFPKTGMFTSSVKSHTQEDGSDLHHYLDKLFASMNMKDRSAFPAYIQAFPYVNGGLFADKIRSPQFTRQARKILIECGDLDWSEINPDIFGSMIQAVVHPDQRAETGMHYTSVSNIMKVIEPLFLDDLKSDFQENYENPKGLEKLLQRLYNIKVFDPACGSGNFLIVAYKELRKLEMEIYHQLRALRINTKGIIFLPKIRLAQFFGIEVDDFAHEIAILSLWLAEHQMNVKFKENFGRIIPPLPLKESGHIVCKNATRVDWNKVCPVNGTSEIYVLGNPPYLGSSNQSEDQKKDLDMVFAGKRNYKSLDYIACWFYKGAEYIAQDIKARLAFVSTNSICQGEQVELLWPYLFDRGLEIGFAHTTFKWQNNAKHNAGVSVVIIGLRNKLARKKKLFTGSNFQLVENIGPYLASGKNLIVQAFSKPLSNLPKMSYGNKPVDGGNLILSKEEFQKLVAQYPAARELTKKLMGSDEFINGKERFCLWIREEKLPQAQAIKPIADRIDAVKKMRLASRAEDARLLASRPFQFRDFISTEKLCIVVPSVSSERREYIPIGFLGSDTVITNLAFAVYEPEHWVFAVLASKMHNVWVRAIGGRMENRIRYSSSLCYNNFPFPDLTDKQKDALSNHVFNILSERENHSEKTMAELYDPEKMPSGLLQAHRDLDVAVEKCYRSKSFSSEEERLDYLLGLYEQMISSKLDGVKASKHA